MFSLRTRLAAVATLFAVLALPTRATAQGVGIDPNMVIVNHNTRSGSLTLLNTRQLPVEVELSVQYGYAGTDSLGQSNVTLLDSAPAGAPDATRWITIFPKRLTLAPLADQTIKFLVRPPADLPDGEYWGRVTINARTGSATVDKIGADTSGITVGLTMVTRTIIPLFYRKGRITAGVAITNLQVSRQSADSLNVSARFTRDGMGAWLGTVAITVKDAAGVVIGTLTRNHATYTTTDPRYVVAITPGAAVGPVTVEMVLGTERNDIQKPLRIPTTGSSASTTVTLP